MSNNQIQKYVDGELYCDVYECPQTSETLQFLKYESDGCGITGKKYNILYRCKFCGKEWFKFMASKNDQKPVWYHNDPEGAAKAQYEQMYDL